MVSEIVSKFMMEASESYKQSEQLGINEAAIEYCRFCEGALNSINIYIQDKELGKKVADKTLELDMMFREEFNKRCKGIVEDMDYLQRYHLYKKIEVDMHLWKAGQKLSFYDWLVKKYDI